MYVTKKLIVAIGASFIGGAALGNFIGKNRAYLNVAKTIVEMLSSICEGNTTSAKNDAEES